MRMLTSLVIMIYILLSSTFSNAQHYIGVTGAGNLATLSVEDETGKKADETSTTNKFAFGAILGLSISEYIYIQAEPMYQKKGGKFIPDIADDPEFRFDGAWLELPVLLKVSFASGSARPYLLAGPTVGFLLSSEVKADINNLTFTADTKDVTENIDFGVTFGAGVSYPIGGVSVFVEGRYMLGLKNIAKSGDVRFTSGTLVINDEISEDSDIKTRGIQLMAGLTIPFGK